ncbi:MAG: hypothetical protein JWR01_384 [Subtercola sp.]|nr:hypothetical protein [Subtercola sp.]
MPDYVSRSEILIRTPSERVWDVLTATGSNPDIMFGADIQSEWTEGSAITWTGEYKGTEFRDTGTVVEVVRPERLVYTHFSPLSGGEDTPANHHTITVTLASVAEGTRVTLAQDKNGTPEAAADSEENWMLMLRGLRTVAQGDPSDE